MLSGVIATLLTIAFIVQLFRGRKYEEWVSGLDDNEFPMKFIYVVGLCWSEIPILSMPDDMRQKLVQNLKLVYDPRDSEYYASIIWAQMVSMVHLVAAGGFAISMIAGTPLFGIVGVVAGVIFAADFYNSSSDTVEKRQDACDGELPEVVSSMALLINSGMMLKEAWETVANSKEGQIYEFMLEACEDMENGVPEQEAIHRFAIKTNSPEIKKFTSSIIQGVEKGSRELSLILANQSSEMWNLKRQYMLQKGEAAASKLLIPITLIFVGVILLVIAGAIGMLTS